MWNPLGEMKWFAPVPRRLGLAAAGVAVGMLVSTSAPASPTSLRSSDEAPAAPACAAVADGTLLGHGYRYCGYHWASWPVTYTVDAVPALPNISVNTNQFRAAAAAAAKAWNDGWSLLHPGELQPFAFNALAGNHVRFASLPVDVQGRTDLEFVVATKVYTKATITLNSNLNWRVASGLDLITGEIPAVFGMLGSGCVTTSGDCDWYDVQDVLTHELGHMLGLEHIDEECFPSDLTHPESTQSTMYACGFPTETNKRTLDWGDVLGVDRVGRDST